MAASVNLLFRSVEWLMIKESTYTWEFATKNPKNRFSQNKAKVPEPRILAYYYGSLTGRLFYHGISSAHKNSSVRYKMTVSVNLRGTTRLMHCCAVALSGP